MIKYKQGNAVSALLDGEADFLMHCCNCQNNFGSGIAKEVRERIPAAYQADIKAYKFESPLLGKFSCGGGVINLYGQEFYGWHPNEHYKKTGMQLCYRALDTAMTRAAVQLGTTNYTIAIPYKMASDRAGGDWDTVIGMVERIFKHQTIVVYSL